MPAVVVSYLIPLLAAIGFCIYPPSSHAMERRSMEFNRHSPIVRSNSPLSPMRDFSLGTPELFRSTAPSLHMSSSLGLRDSKDYDRIYSADHAMEGRADKNDNVSVLSCP
ncbi:hypothetical protein BASA60_010364 [Batrachochytrium salamandrivorans]|nr:hypothetical protein BASA60_010364 [Batrachochytrium salamandrivorans]